MRRQSTPLFTNLGKEEITGIIHIAKEIISMDCKNSTDKIFSSADLWNIQRQKRTFVQRRVSL